MAWYARCSRQPVMKIHTALITATLLAAMPALAAPSTPSTPSAMSPLAPATVYRLEFELTTTEPGKPPSTTQFALNVVEHRTAELTIGDNVPLRGSTTATSSPMFQHVGTRVAASFEARGADLLLDVTTEVSGFAGPGVVHKVEAKDVALAVIGQKTVVASIDHDRAHTQLVVTPSRL